MTRERRLGIAIALNAGVVVVQVGFGLVAHSLGLLSDAGHNLADVAALAISLYALRIARRAPTAHRSFGWHRGTVLAAQGNSALMLALCVWIAIEAIRRFSDPPSVEGGIVLVVALIGFVANAAGARIVSEHHGHAHSHSHAHRHDLNMASARLHLLSDAATSLGVALTGAIIMVTDGWAWLDPAASLAISALIGHQAWQLLGASNAVLLEGTPPDLDVEELTRAIEAIEGVGAVHDIHAWAISGDKRALSAHIVVEASSSLSEAQRISVAVKSELAQRFRIGHSTIEIEGEECGASDCDLGEIHAN